MTEQRLTAAHGSTASAGFSISSQVLPGLMAALDTLAIWSVALVFFAVLVGGYLDQAEHYITAICFVWLVALMLMHFAGLYKLEPIMRPLGFVDKFLVAFLTTVLFLLAAVFALKVSADFSRSWMAAFTAGACSATLVVRIIASLVLRRLADKRVFTRHVVIVGAGEQAKRLFAHIDAHPPQFVSVLGVFAQDKSTISPLSNRYPVLGTFDDVVAFARHNKVDDVVIALPWSADEQITTLVGMLRELPVHVYLGSDLVGFRLPFRAPPDHFGGMPLVEVMGHPLAGWGSVQKAALDYGLGFVLAVLLAPLIAIIAIAIKLDSPGPVLFRQKRYGFVNRIFLINKFRTMRHSDVTEEKTKQATRDDPRVTRLGRFLRRTSLDELPQLFNVLNGTMSLVGPRPHANDHNEIYSQLVMGYFIRHRVKPGITGWAQVNGYRGETKTLEDIEARVRYDIYYVDNWSSLLDLRILIRTVLICLTGRNAY
jgi:putative colanic acid biosysnthesis UDP-glucose lipid carrier transferase